MDSRTARILLAGTQLPRLRELSITLDNAPMDTLEPLLQFNIERLELNSIPVGFEDSLARIIPQLKSITYLHIFYPQSPENFNGVFNALLKTPASPKGGWTRACPQLQHFVCSGFGTIIGYSRLHDVYMARVERSDWPMLIYVMSRPEGKDWQDWMSGLHFDNHPCF